MEFTRHARNRMRHFRLSEQDVERIVGTAEREDTDREGHRRYTGRLGDRRIRVVLAREGSTLVVTVHERRR